MGRRRKKVDAGECVCGHGWWWHDHTADTRTPGVCGQVRPALISDGRLVGPCGCLRWTQRRGYQPPPEPRALLVALAATYYV